MAQHAQPAQSDISIPRLIGTSMLARLIVDTGVHIFNPFLPIIAEGLKTNIVTLGALVSLRSSTGLTSPIFGALADQHGFRQILRLGLLAGAGGAFLVATSTSVLMAAAGMVLWGIGLAAFVPTLQAYLSARLPYERRARAIGVLEYSWALASIVGLYAAGLMIDATGWRTPFYVLAAGMAIMAVVIGTFPSARAGHSSLPGAAADTDPAVPWYRWDQQRVVRFFDLGDNARSAYSTILSSSLTFFAAMEVMIIYGGWLAHEYGLGAVQLGTVGLLLGVADLCGSISVSLFTDRIGKRRSVILGNVGAIVGYLLMPILNMNVGLAVLGIALARCSFEFSIVSNISLLSEQVPTQRGKVMTLGAACNLLGGTVAGFVGPRLYLQFGIAGVTVLSAICTLLAFLILSHHVREKG